MKPHKNRHKFPAKKLRNKILCCHCYGWHFPHRIGSRASPEYIEANGPAGCFNEKSGRTTVKLPSGSYISA